MLKILIFFLIAIPNLLSGALQDNNVETQESRQKFYAIIKYYEEEIRKDPQNLKLILAVAEVYSSLKNYDKAVEYYRKALELEPNNLNIQIQLGLAYLNNNDFSKSQELLDKLVKLEPDNVDILSGLGRLEALKHHLPQAEILYQKVLAKDPNHFTTLFYLAELRIEEKRYIEAQEILKKLLSRDPQAAWIKQALKRAELGPVFEKVTKLEEKGDYRTGILIFQEELSKDPDNLELYLGLGKLYTKSKQYAEAINILNEGLARYPNENSIRLALGFTYLAKNDLTDAEFFFLEQSLKGGPGQAEAFAGLGRVAALRGDLARAEQFYQKSIQLNPFSTLALSYLAQAHLEKKQYEEAQHLFEKILQIDPNAKWAKQAIEEAKMAPLLDHITQLENNNDYEEAERLYKLLLSQFPLNYNNYIRLAHFYRNHKSYQQAIEVTLRGLQANPNAIPLYVSLADDYFLNGELQQSQNTLKLILEKDPFNTEALAGLGRIEAKIGNPTNATNFYHLALSINPKEITALSYLIDLEMEQKNYAQVQLLLQRVLQIEPHAEWAKQIFIRAQYAPLFNEIKILEDEDNQYAAIQKYKELLKLAPESEDVYLGLGQLYLKLKRYPEAVQLYKQGLEINPNANQLLVNLGLTYIYMNDLKKANHALQRARHIDPKNPDAIAGLGRIADLNGDKETALKLYDTALRINPENLLILSYLADFWMHEHQFTKARKIYEKILQINPKATWAKVAEQEAKYAPILLEAAEKENNKEYADAEAIYIDLIEEFPRNVDYYIRLGQLYVKINRYQEAIVLYQKGLNLAPNSMDLQIALGFAYLAKGDLNVGKHFFDLVLKKDSENPEALAGIGRFYELNNDPNTAINWYQKALKVNPNNITALVYLSQIMFELGHYDYAQKLYSQIYLLQPSPWIKLALLDAKHGRLLSAIKKSEKAEDFLTAEVLWRQLVQEEPDNADYYLRFGLFYHKIKQYEKAINTYSKGIELDPSSSDLYAALGLVYLSKKDLVSAQKAFNRSLKRDPKNPDALAGLGYIAMVHGQLKKSEDLIKAALVIDPNRIAALSSLGDLWIKEKRFSEAQQVYEKLLALRPHEKWIKLSLDEAKYGNDLEKIKELILQEQYAEAATIYQNLLEQSPDNPRFYFGLGQMYMRLKEYGKSIEINLEGLKKNPDENAIRIALGYAYFFNNNLSEAREALTKAIQIDAKDPEALAGLGRVNTLEENYCEAEALYLKALSYDPKNQSALSFYGDLLMLQHRFTEAQDIFARLSQVIPDALWVQRSWQNAVDGPTTTIANELANREEFELAANIYRQLLEAAPDDPARYLPLGQMYVNLQDYCCGIRIFQQGLMIDPEAWYLWRAIGFTYILMEDFAASQNIFEFLTAQDPDDAESWAGLGRIQALNGSICLAQQYYAAALEIDSKNLLTLSFLADLETDMQFFISAAETYESINTIVEKNMMGRCEPIPKWVRRGYNNALNLACPTISIGGFYHEEDEWDHTLDQWTAQYLVYGGKALVNYPIRDDLIVWGSVTDQFYSLNDLPTHQSLYSFDVQRYYLSAKWIYNPCFFIEAKAGLTNYSPYRRSTFRVLKGVIAEPTLTFAYHEPIQKASLSFTSGSDLVARNFKKNIAELVGYYFIAGTYERRIIKRGWIGFEADAYWYNDFVKNNSQRVLGWFQWRPPYYSDNIIFRYYVKFQTFAKNIPDYYTYKPQIVNQLQITLEKYWRVCWADTFYTSLSYGHGWQDTHTRFADIIVINVLPVNQPFIWDRRQFDIFFGTLIYNYGQLQFKLGGDYYRDTEKYTIWSIAGDLTWRF